MPHPPHAAPARPTRRLAAVLVLTAAFTVVEALGGWLSGALALLADAGHMLTDVGALGLALAGARMAERPADSSKTYGYLRWEILAALVNGALLITIAGWITVEAIGRLGQPHEVNAPLFGAVAVAGLGVNLVALRLLHAGHRHGSLNTRAAYLHVLSDLLGSVGALTAAVVVGVTGWTAADPLVSLGIAVLIVIGAGRILRESVNVLLEAAPAHIAVPELERRMRAVPGVANVHDLHLWTVTSGVVAMSGHAVVPALADHPGALEGLRVAAAGLGIHHVTIQLETEEGCEDAGCGGGGAG
ncbi:MAG TPA: cation diffusion facilitator family transporter [Gemmatimonadales bacterium]|nr:cation diffusion facilitator family transporter [Gemmatimonadales bacterium]